MAGGGWWFSEFRSFGKSAWGSLRHRSQSFAPFALYCGELAKGRKVDTAHPPAADDARLDVEEKRNAFLPRRPGGCGKSESPKVWVSPRAMLLTCPFGFSWIGDGF